MYDRRIARPTGPQLTPRIANMKVVNDSSSVVLTVCIAFVFTLAFDFIPQSHSLTIRPQRSFGCVSRVPTAIRTEPQQRKLPKTEARILTSNNDNFIGSSGISSATSTASTIGSIRGGGPSAAGVITSPTFWLSEYGLWQRTSASHMYHYVCVYGDADLPFEGSGQSAFQYLGMRYVLLICNQLM